MPVLQIDVETRLAIAQAIMENPETVSVITLPSGTQLRLFCHCGHVAAELIAEDLLDESVDVSMQVLEDLKNHREAVKNHE